MQKIVLITGTSTGLGVSLAVKAAQAGHKVYATMRNLDKRTALDEAAAVAGVAVEVLELDVQKTASVEAAVKQITDADGRIDVLINNAGSGFVRTTEQASEKDIQWVMDVNFMGVVRCTKAVLPHMRARRSGHVIAISSVGGLVGQPFNEVYCAAKFAVEGYIESLASYVGPSFGLQFTAVEPGGIATEFGNNIMKHVADTGGLLLEDAYAPVMEKYMSGIQGRQGTGTYQTPDEVADVVLACVANEDPPVRVRTSPWAEDLCRFKTDADPDGKKLRAKVVSDFLSG
ncbi:SDR family oxidoreductase [Roseibium sp. RKSG952]|uniref:SDR family oxidoreductase n=1 Tax=Roseibium sp. RKSG952 TaxID=2529384 RepID=UPI0012BD1B27|nr:SDR family oxidoreductase [Roseibium sp. RKSG952]MTH96489.1 SDR family oxidoreductase [Roseibium sp. RKSG952]